MRAPHERPSTLHFRSTCTGRVPALSLKCYPGLYSHESNIATSIRLFVVADAMLRSSASAPESISAPESTSAHKSILQGTDSVLTVDRARNKQVVSASPNPSSRLYLQGYNVTL